MKWIGQHIWDFISRFRTTVYIENLETSSEENVLVVDSDGKVTKNTTLGGSDLTLTNAGDNRVITSTGGTGLNAEADITYDTPAGLPYLHFSTSSINTFDLTTSNTGAQGPKQGFNKTADGENNDILGTTYYKGKNDSGSGSLKTFVEFQGEITDASANDEAGKFTIKVLSNSTSVLDAITATGNGTSDITNIGLGYGAASVTTIAGDLDIDGDNMTAAGALTFTPGGLFKTVASGMEIENGSTTGAPALLIDNDDADQVALSIDAANTTADIISVTGNAMTTGSFINYTGVATGTNSNGLIDLDITNADDGTSISYVQVVDYNKTGVIPSTGIFAFKGIVIDYDDTATNDANAAMSAVGLEIDLTNSSDQGTVGQVGIDIDCSGGDVDHTTGIKIQTPHESNDIYIYNGSGDSFATSIKANGETTLSTDDGNAGTTTAHLNLDADGDIVLDSASGVIKTGSTTFVNNSGVIQVAAQTNITSLGTLTNLQVDDVNINTKSIQILGDTGDTFNITTGAAGATTLTTVDAGGTAGHLNLDPDGGINLTPAEASSVKLKMGGAEETNGPIIIVNSEDETFASFGAESGSASNFYLYDAGGTTSTSFFRISTDALASTIISTVDNSGTQADLTLDIDGEIKMKSDENKIKQTFDFQGKPFETTYSDDQVSGTILKYSPGANDTLNGSEIYYLHSDQTWNQAQANAVANGASQLLGVGQGGSSQTIGVLLEGFVRVAYTEYLGTPVAGAPVYISETTAGHFDFTAPSGNNEYVRIVGYCIDAHNPGSGNDVLIYFKPDNTWVEITA